MEDKKIKRSLVVSGGGAMGAWGGGLLQYLIEEKGYDWDSYYGTSTGSLLITLIALQETQKLKDKYTSVTNKDIFSVNPFTKKGKINYFNLIWRTIRKKNSLGEAAGLEKIIREMFTEKEFNMLVNMNRPLYPCATDFYSKSPKYVCNLEVDYDTYVKFTLASASVPVAMDYVDVSGFLLLDGGVTQHIPIQKAIDDGADEIDIIVFRPENIDYDGWQPKGWFDTLLRTTAIQETQVSLNNVTIANLNAKDKDVKLRFRYTPYVLTTNSLIFNKEQMLKWWKEGYEYGKLDGTSVKVKIMNNNSNLRNYRYL